MKKILLVFILFCATFIVATRVVPRFYLILITNPPSVLMVKNLKEQVSCAKKAGFVFEPPILRVIKRPYMPGNPHGFAHMHLNIITLVSFASYQTLAHELGHIIDYQTGRKGHPIFQGKEDWDNQRLANMIKDIILNECKFTNKPPAD